MITKSLLVVVAVLLLASPAFSQFGATEPANDLAGRLSRDAQDFADSSYSNFTNNSARTSQRYRSGDAGAPVCRSVADFLSHGG